MVERWLWEIEKAGGLGRWDVERYVKLEQKRDRDRQEKVGLEEERSVYVDVLEG